MPWFRLFSEARNDAKLRALADDEHRVWFNLLCLSGESEDRGTVCIDGFVLAVEVSGGDEDLLARTLDKLTTLRVVGRDEQGRLYFVHFRERQYDKPSDTPERVAERVRKHRSAKKDAGNGCNAIQALHDVTPVTTVTKGAKKDSESTAKSRAGGVTDAAKKPDATRFLERVTPRNADVTPRNAQEEDKENRYRGESDDSPLAAQAPPVNEPHRLFSVFCDLTFVDQSDVPKATKDKQHGIFKNLLDKYSAADVEGCMRWLTTWRTVPWTPEALPKEIDTWILEKRPANGKRPPPRPSNGAAALDSSKYKDGAHLKVRGRM